MNMSSFESIATIAKESKQRTVGKPAGFKRSIFDKCTESDPIYTKEQLAEAKDSSYKEGYTKASSEINAESESHKRQMLAVNEAIKNNLEQLNNKIDGLQHGAIVDMINVSLMVAKKIVGKILNEEHEKVIKNTVKQSLELLVKEPVVTVKVSPSSHESINNNIKSIIDELLFKGKVVIESDDHLSDLDCSVEWQDGIIEGDKNKIWEAIDAILLENSEQDNIVEESLDVQEPDLGSGAEQED